MTQFRMDRAGLKNREIRVRAVFKSSGCNASIQHHRIAGAPSVFFHPGQTNLFSCGAKACNDQIGVLPQVVSWEVAVMAALNMLSGTRQGTSSQYQNSYLDLANTETAMLSIRNKM